ncbi:MAG: hypothetical protein K5771_06635 [Oscillospiraceae bacterium]|nr:hypothetical protein [Oscillospiraceae bacterium]
MNSRRKGITLAALLGGVVLVLILVIGTIWTGRSARKDTESAVRSVSLLYLDELAGRREQVVAANIRQKIDVIETALDLITEEDLSDNAHLQAFQSRIKSLFNLERFAFFGADGLVYTAAGPRAEADQYHFDYTALEGRISSLRIWTARTKRSSSLCPRIYSSPIRSCWHVSCRST